MYIGYNVACKHGLKVHTHEGCTLTKGADRKNSRFLGLDRVPSLGKDLGVASRFPGGIKSFLVLVVGFAHSTIGVLCLRQVTFSICTAMLLNLTFNVGTVIGRGAFVSSWFVSVF